MTAFRLPQVLMKTANVMPHQAEEVNQTVVLLDHDEDEPDFDFNQVPDEMYDYGLMVRPVGSSFEPWEPHALLR